MLIDYCACVENFKLILGNFERIAIACIIDLHNQRKEIQRRCAGL